MANAFLQLQFFYECQSVRVKTLKLTSLELERLSNELGFVPYDREARKLSLFGTTIKLKD